MRKTLDFNSLERPAIELTMRDEARTVINVTAATEGLIEKLEANGDQLVKASKGKSIEAIKAVYSLMADVMSCNLEGLKITAEELRDKYRLKLEDLVVFFSVYMELIDEIKHVKN